MKKIITLEHGTKKFKIDTSKFIDISIPYNFNGLQPNFYNVIPGKMKSFEDNNKCYSVKEGAGCNVLEISMNIHCTGTHTECIGHIIEEKRSIPSFINNLFIPAVLITVKPVIFEECDDIYHVQLQNDEKVLSKELILKQFIKFKKFTPTCLIIRTLPNNKNKKFYSYPKKIPPFFTNNAIEYLNNCKILHLVVDMPSVDRMYDNGILGNHRIFWGGKPDRKLDIFKDSEKTITELAYIPNHIEDGFYFLNIQIPNFQIDAAPSRPILFKVEH
mgnify:CR=1 FL=1